MVGNRSFQFDNLKSLLILLVVLGHTIEPAILLKPTLRYIYIIIYSFHMPLFIFITGYFSKVSKKGTIDKVKKFLIIYIIIQYLYSLFFVYIMKVPGFKNNFLYPNYALWYLQTLILWYILSDYFNGFLKWFIGSIVFSLIVGFDSNINTYLSLSRTFTFLPFFVAGYYFKLEYMEKIKKQKFFITLFAIIISTGIFMYSKYINIKILNGAYPYIQVYQNVYTGFFARILVLIAAIGLSLFVLAWIPKTKNVFSFWGKITLFIYIIHPPVIQLINKYRLFSFNGKLEIIKMILFTVISSYLCAYFIYLVAKYFKELKKKNITIGLNKKA